jgi:hypothetical protein
MVDPFGQVQRGGKVADLRHGQSNFLHLIQPGIELLNGDAILKGIDDDILLQMGVALIDKRDHSRIEFVFYGKHDASLRRVAINASPQRPAPVAGLRRSAGADCQHRVSGSGVCCGGCYA